MKTLSLPIRFGLVTSAVLIAYFLILALFNKHTNPVFSFFNAVITVFGIYEAVRLKKLKEAELKGTQIIDAYHFLVSIAKETKEANEKEYLATIETGIDDFKHKGLVLEITFMNGATYEYFGIAKNQYLKFLNADKQMRFAKRNVCHSYIYRRTKKAQEEEKAPIAL